MCFVFSHCHSTTTTTALSQLVEVLIGSAVCFNGCSSSIFGFPFKIMLYVCTYTCSNWKCSQHLRCKPCTVFLNDFCLCLNFLSMFDIILCMFEFLYVCLYLIYRVADVLSCVQSHISHTCTVV